MTNIIVAGSRSIKSYKVVRRALIDYFKPRGYKKEDVTIVSGGANGVDKLGEKFADEFGLGKKIMNADWDRFGNSAGYRRNVDMANCSQECVVLWDGKSSGSKHMIDIAKSKGLETTVIEIIY